MILKFEDAAFDGGHHKLEERRLRFARREVEKGLNLEQLKGFLEEGNGDEAEDEGEYGHPTEEGSQHRREIVSDDRNRQ